MTVKRQRPRIALVVDTVGWAFWNIAQQLKRRLADRYDIRIIAARELDDDIVRILLLTQDCDLVHFFWREHFFLFDTPYTRDHVESLGVPFDTFVQRFVRGRCFSTSIYDHLYLDDEAARGRQHIFAERVRGYYVSSEKLRREYARLDGYPSPTAVLPDGVDTQLFAPKNLRRFGTVGSRPLVVGWSGNSEWVRELDDFKGVDTFLRPALAQLEREGVPVVAHFADRKDRMIPHVEMPDYYSRIDVYVCTSKCEGTPNPVLEAMACGVPVISTDVGIVSESFGPAQRAFIVERRVDAIAAALKRLASSASLAQALSAENLGRAASLDWSTRMPGFVAYFDELLAFSAVAGETAAGAPTSVARIA